MEMITVGLMSSLAAGVAFLTIAACWWSGRVLGGDDKS